MNYQKILATSWKPLNKLIAGMITTTLSFFTANALYLSLIALIPRITLYDKPFGILLHTLIFIIVAHFFFKWWYKELHSQIQVQHLAMLLPYLFIIVLRFPILHPMADDVAGHYHLGEYARTLWTNHHFMAAHIATYFYPAVDMLYTPFLYLIGLRLSIFLLYAVVSIWMISLFVRFLDLVPRTTQKLLMIVLFLMLPYIPHLIATHGTMMVDYIALVVTLETFYQFIVKKKDYTFAAFLVLLSVLMKQSTSIFFIPLFLYYMFIKRAQISWRPLIAFGGVVFIYFVRLQVETGNMLFGLYNGIFKSALYDAGNFRDNSFGPLTLKDTLLWPFTGQFTDRFGQGFTTRLQRYFFAPLPIISFSMVIVMAIWKRSAKYIIFVLCYFMWMFMSGYSRYVIPLNLLILLSLIIDLKLPEFRFLRNKPLVIAGLMCIWILSMTSLKTDFAWRPTLNIFSNRQNNPYLVTGLQNGLKLLYVDSMTAYIEEQRPLFKGYDAIVPVYRGDATFLSFLGSKSSGAPIIKAVGFKERKAILKDPKISEHIKQNLTQLDSMKHVILLVERSQEDTYYLKRDLDIKHHFTCERKGQYKQSKYFQAAYQFEEIVIYDCVPRI
jgi:hypothetical protein